MDNEFDTDDETKPYAKVLKEYYAKNKRRAKKITNDTGSDYVNADEPAETIGSN